ncbi:MAG TPA: c-type cytochrome [Campylobacterales bacterium]|nr:c-type cytochrome [Campylobacterales bacterium]
MKLINLSLLTAFLAVGCSDTTNETNTSKNPSQQTKYFTECNSSRAFIRPVSGMSHEETDLFILGKSFYRIPWVEAPSATTARDGLGPLFNANTCMHCHPKNGAGVAINSDGSMTRSHLLRLSHRNSTNEELMKTVGFEPDSTYGSQLSLNGNADVPAEGLPKVSYTEINGTYPDGSPYSLRKPSYRVENLGYGAMDNETIIAPRIGLALIGLGQLELIDEKDILANEDIEDKNGDGISGKANWAYSPETNTTMLGRFTWKASATTVKHQSAAAAHNDMGLSNPLFPQHNCTDKQKLCLEEAQKGRHAFDLPEERLSAITYYLSNLAIPKQRHPEKHQEGAKLFSSLNCTACHTPSFKTAMGLTIHPYSDLLLHDMGKDLADGRREFLATGNEWRTPPLWGIGLYEEVSGEANYLHDGRARSIEEAILWHGGEAEKSKEDFMALSREKREKLLEFLESI